MAPSVVARRSVMYCTVSLVHVGVEFVEECRLFQVSLFFLFSERKTVGIFVQYGIVCFEVENNGDVFSPS